MLQKQVLLKFLQNIRNIVISFIALHLSKQMDLYVPSSREHYDIFIATLHARKVMFHCSSSIPLIWCCNKKPLPIDLSRADKLI